MTDAIAAPLSSAGVNHSTASRRLDDQRGTAPVLRHVKQDAQERRATRKSGGPPRCECTSAIRTIANNKSTSRPAAHSKGDVHR